MDSLGGTFSIWKFGFINLNFRFLKKCRIFFDYLFQPFSVRKDIIKIIIIIYNNLKKIFENIFFMWDNFDYYQSLILYEWIEKYIKFSIPVFGAAYIYIYIFMNVLFFLPIFCI